MKKWIKRFLWGLGGIFAAWLGVIVINIATYTPFMDPTIDLRYLMPQIRWLYAPKVDPRYADKIGTGDHPRFELVMYAPQASTDNPGVSWSADSSRFARAGNKRHSLWTRDGKLIKKFTHSGGFTQGGGKLSPDGKYLVMGHLGDDRFIVEDVMTGEVVYATPVGDFGSFNYLTFSPDGRFLLGIFTIRDHDRIEVHDTTTWRKVRDIDISDHFGFRTLAVSPDNQTVATGDLDGVVHIYNFHTGKKVKTFRAHCHTIREMAYDATGTYLYTGDSSIDFTPEPDSPARACTDPNPLKKWLVKDGSKVMHTGEDMGVDRGFTAEFDALAISPRYPIAAVGYHYYRVNLYDVTNGQVYLTLPIIGIAVAAAFSPDGQYLAVSDIDTVYLWRVITPD